MIDDVILTSLDDRADHTLPNDRASSFITLPCPSPGIDDILTHDSARNACRVQLPLRALENSRACKEMGSLHKLYILYMKQQV